MGIEIRGLREDEFGVHDELIYESYKEYDREGHEDRWWSHIATHDPYYEPEQTRVMLVDGEMVASVSNYLREMYCAGRHAKISAIGSVATHPNHRRKGYVRQVLAESRQWMLDSGFDFSCLFGAVDDLDTAGLAASTGVNLGLDYPHAPAQFARSFHGGKGRTGHDAGRHRDSVLGEQILRLVFMKIHAYSSQLDSEFLTPDPGRVPGFW